MIYMISDSELQVFATASGLNCLDISPLSTLIDSHRISFGKTFSEKAEGLSRLGLFEDAATGTLSAEGMLMAQVLMRPDCVIAFGRKNSLDEIFYAMKREQLWYLYSYKKAYKLCIVMAYLSTSMLSEWLNEQMLAGYAPTVKSYGKFDITLTYEEWYTFLMSQLIFIRREKKDRIGSDWFTIADICSPAALKYIKKKLEYLNFRIQNELLDRLFDGLDDTELLSALSQLHKKGLLDIKKTSDGKGIMRYSVPCVEWLDNSTTTDSVFLNIRRPDSSHTMLFILRDNGVVSMFDSGHDVRLFSSDTIRWELYLK